MRIKHQKTIYTAIALLMSLSACVTKPESSFEYIHLPGTEPSAGVSSPFTSAIKVGSGQVVFLSGITGAPAS